MRLHRRSRHIPLGIKLAILMLLVIFIGIPLIFKISVTLQKAVVFMNFVKYDKGFNFRISNDIEDVKNLYLSYCDTELKKDRDCRVTLGVWHILPSGDNEYFISENQSKLIVQHNLKDAYNDVFVGTIYPSLSINDEFDISKNSIAGAEMSDGRPVVLYLHGNTGTRALNYRLNTYKLLKKLGCHIITMDYRSFGDSSNIEPSEEGIVKDSLAVYKWISSVAKGPIILWGHSLGSAIATHLLCKMQNKMFGPNALILESAFTNLYDEIYVHKYSLIFKFLPWFDLTIRNSIRESGMKFNSDQHVSCFHQPILFLHAEDDRVVPLVLGYRLFRIARRGRDASWGPTIFHRFDANKNLGHRYISLDFDVYFILRDFLQYYAAERY